MKFLIVSLLQLWVLIGINAQGIVWENANWANILKNADQSNKLIFVDVYTDWCRPCLQMDRNVFADSALADFFHTNFISVKINGEDENFGEDFAKRYKINAYPGLLFIDGKGQVISSFMGYHSKYELKKIAEQTITLYGHQNFLADIKSNLHKHYSSEELRDILTISQIHPFDGKEKLAMKYLDGIEQITEDDMRLVMNEIQRMGLSYLSRLAPLTTSLSYKEIYLRPNAQEWLVWKSSTEQAIHERLSRYKLEDNLSSFEATLEILKGINGTNNRQVDNLYLSYYKHNNLDQYKTFAAYIIEAYIIPVHPKEVKKADEEKYILLRNEIEKDMKASLVEIYTSDTSKETSSTPMLDSLVQIYTYSKSLADQLYEISGDFYALYEDESSRRKATFWASLSHLYYPYDMKYFDNHLFILESTGRLEEAREIVAKIKLLPWYGEMSKRNSF